MSYDLAFWKQTSRIVPPILGETYARLCEDMNRQIVGLEEIPIKDLLTGLAVSFPALEVTEPSEEVPAGSVFWSSEDDTAGFHGSWTQLALIVSCSPTDTDVINKIIDVAAEAGCPLYDPQTDERFD